MLSEFCLIAHSHTSNTFLPLLNLNKGEIKECQRSLAKAHEIYEIG